VQIGDGLDGLLFGAAHDRNADLHLRHTGIRQRLRDGDFLIEGERHAGALFTVVQRGVVDDDGNVGHGGCPASATRVDYS
jgi:hypothetical protein